MSRFLVAVMCCFTLAGCMDVPLLRDLFDSRPAPEEIEARLNQYDARGDGGPFAVSMWADWPPYGNLPITLQYDPASRIARLEVGSLVTFMFRSGAETRFFKFDSEWFEERLLEQGGYLPAPNFQITDVHEGTYRGRHEGEPVEVTLDDSGRFRQIRMFVPGWGYEEGTFAYDTSPIHTLPRYATRVPIHILPPGQNREAGQLHYRTIIADAQAQPNHLLVTFHDVNGSVMESTRFSQKLDGEFFFEWIDVNENGLVGSPDGYMTRFPNRTVDVRILDEWAGELTHGSGIESAPAPFVLLPLLYALSVILDRAKRESRA